MAHRLFCNDKKIKIYETHNRYVWIWIFVVCPNIFTYTNKYLYFVNKTQTYLKFSLGKALTTCRMALNLKSSGTLAASKNWSYNLYVQTGSGSSRKYNFNNDETLWTSCLTLGSATSMGNATSTSFSSYLRLLATEVSKAALKNK